MGVKSLTGSNDWCDARAGRRNEKVVAVGRRTRDEFRSEHAARAWTVVDDDWLPGELVHACCEDAREHIAGAAGGELRH
jgi:hypothetical protein